LFGSSRLQDLERGEVGGSEGYNWLALGPPGGEKEEAWREGGREGGSRG